MSLSVKLELEVRERQVFDTHRRNVYHVAVSDLLGQWGPLQLTNEAFSADEFADYVQNLKTRLDGLVGQARVADAKLKQGERRALRG